MPGLGSWGVSCRWVPALQAAPPTVPSAGGRSDSCCARGVHQTAAGPFAVKACPDAKSPGAACTPGAANVTGRPNQAGAYGCCACRRWGGAGRASGRAHGARAALAPLAVSSSACPAALLSPCRPLATQCCLPSAPLQGQGLAAVRTRFRLDPRGALVPRPAPQLHCARSRAAGRHAGALTGARMLGNPQLGCQPAMMWAQVLLAVSPPAPLMQPSHATRTLAAHPPGARGVMGRAWRWMGAPRRQWHA